MKKVIGMLALIALVGNIANAELLKNFKYDGKIEVNAFQVKDADYDKDAADKRNDVDTRVQLNMGFDLTQDVDAVVSAVKANRQYNAASEDANDLQNNLQFEQAYLNLKGVLGFDHKLGRQYYGNEGDLVIYYGPRSWPFNNGAGANGLPVTGLDGYTGWYNYGKWNFNGVLAKATNVNDLVAPVTGDNDLDIFGLNAKYDLNESLKLGGYFYRANEQAGTGVAGPADHLDTIGVKAMGVFKGFEYNAEFAKNMGKNNQIINPTVGQAATNDYTGMGFMANAKYGLDLAGKLTLMGEFAMGSGDDDVAATDDEIATFATPNSDYRPGIIWGGDYMVVGGAGLSNLTTFNLGAMWNPSKIEKLTLGAKYLNFSPTEDAGLGYDTYGNELDLCANWQHSENVGLKAYYAMFMPDSDFAVAMNGAGAADDSTEILGAAFTVKF